jgi:hypothetical protein
VELKGIYGPKSENAVKGGITYSLYSSQSIIMANKDQVGHIVLMGEKRNAYIFSKDWMRTGHLEHLA